MKRLELALFAIAVALFCGSVAVPGSEAIAQMANWCPGGSNLLCGTDTTRTCTQIDQRTGQCSRWREQALYYYHPKEGAGADPGDGGGGCGKAACPY